MDTLEFCGYQIKFDTNSLDNVEEFKETFYSIVTFLLLHKDPIGWNPWHSANIEKGGHITFQYDKTYNNPTFNFSLHVVENFHLVRFSITKHGERNIKSKNYKIKEYKQLYKDLFLLV